MTAGATVKKQPRGKPFEKGVDPRRNIGGGRPRVLTTAVMAATTPERARAIADIVLERAEAGDLQAIAMIWDRLEGKAIARNENGQPGEFEIVLDDDERERLRAALQVVRGKRDA